MRLFGLGDLGSTWPSNTPTVVGCGDSNPCTWWDNVYARDACLNYMKCAIPDDPTTIYLDQGVGAGVGAEAGGVASGVASGVGQGIASNLTPSGAFTGAAVIGVGIFVAVLLLRR